MKRIKEIEPKRIAANIIAEYENNQYKPIKINDVITECLIRNL